MGNLKPFGIHLYIPLSFQCNVIHLVLSVKTESAPTILQNLSRCILFPVKQCAHQTHCRTSNSTLHVYRLYIPFSIHTVLYVLIHVMRLRSLQKQIDVIFNKYMPQNAGFVKGVILLELKAVFNLSKNNKEKNINLMDISAHRNVTQFFSLGIIQV